jgi:hypothetical protein
MRFVMIRDSYALRSVPISLTQEQLDWIIKDTTRRFEEHERKGTKDLMVHEEVTSFEGTVEGVKGEVATGIFLGIDWKSQIGLATAAQKDHDLIAGGHTYEVKTRIGDEEANFIIPHGRSKYTGEWIRTFEADFGVMCRTHMGSLRVLLIGCFTMPDWNESWKIRDFGKGDRQHYPWQKFRAVLGTN